MAGPLEPQNRLYSRDTVDLLSNEKAQHGTVAQYLSYLGDLYGGESAPAIYTDILEPVAQWSGQAPFSDEETERTSRIAFLNGGVLGLRVAQKYGNAALLKAMAAVEPEPMRAVALEPGRTTKRFDPASSVGPALLKIARVEHTLACAKTKEIGTLITEWSKEVDLEQYMHLTELGFGLMGHYACLGMVRLDAEKMVKRNTRYDLKQILPRPGDGTTSA